MGRKNNFIYHQWWGLALPCPSLRPIIACYCASYRIPLSWQPVEIVGVWSNFRREDVFFRNALTENLDPTTDVHFFNGQPGLCGFVLMNGRIMRSRATEPARSLFIRKKQIVIRNIRHPDNQHSHAALCPVDDSGGNVNDGTWADGVVNTVEPHAALAFEDVIQFGAAAVKMFLRAVDVDDVCPSGQVLVLPAEQQMTPAAGAPLARGVVFVANDCGGGHDAVFQ